MSYFFIIAGLIILFLGGEILVRGAVSLAKNWGLSPFVIGLTIVAYGTSAPELIISLQSAMGGHADIAFGNVVGSNLSNLLCIFGLTAIIYPIAIDKKLSFYDGAFMLAVTLLLFFLASFGEISAVSASIFLAVLVVYTVITFRLAKKRGDRLPEAQMEEIDEQTDANLKLSHALIACFFGFFFLMVGANILVENAVIVARRFGASEAVIGLTLVAFGGSVPELVTSLIAALHRRSEIVFGNIIGSNLFNILGILGITGFVAPIAVSAQFIRVDLPILTAVTFALFLVMWRLPQISRALGVVLFGGYLSYVAFLVF